MIGGNHFQFNFLPFGVSSSPAIFQAFLSKILNGIDNIIIYQDDILVLSATIEEHNKVLEEVLSRLKAAGLKLNVHKCQFFTQSVKYLGYIFTKDGVKPCPNKIKAIIDAPKPANLTQVQSFIGLCNFYNRYVPNFSQKFAPLYKLLKKNVKFSWGQEQNDCFEYVKSLFKNNSILKLYDPSKEIKLECDASSTGIGAALFQKFNNEWHPIQFASRTLNKSEQNYAQIEREALSVIFGCERFKQYLLGTKFIINNDHKPLSKLFNKTSGISPNCSARLKRWSLRLSQFNYEFVYTKGKENVNSDFLSRHPLNETEENCEPYELIFVINTLDNTPISCYDIEKCTNSDSFLCQLKSYIKNGFPIHVDNSMKCFKKISHDLSILKGCIMYRNRVYLPDKLRQPVLNLIHQGHPGIVAMKTIARSLVWYPGIDTDITKIVKDCKQCNSVLPKPSQKQHLEWPKPEAKWSRIHADHCFPEGKICLIVVDALTKYIECEIVKDTSASETIETLRVIFSRHGLPNTLVTDNATSFTAAEVKEFMQSNGITHLTSPPYQPSSNGQAERSVRVIKDLLKKNTNGSFKTRLSNILLHYRTTPHSSTNISPCVALNGRKYVTIKDRINPCNVPNVKKSDKMLKTFNIGDSVLALNLRPGKKWLEATIVDKIAVNVYNVLIHDLNVVWKRHLTQLHSHNSVDENNTNNNHQNVPCNSRLYERNVNLPISTTNAHSNDVIIPMQSVTHNPIVTNDLPNLNVQSNAPRETVNSERDAMERTADQSVAAPHSSSECTAQPADALAHTADSCAPRPHCSPRRSTRVRNPPIRYSP